MEDGRCTKCFLKGFRDQTSMDKNGYPEYYRPNDGRAYDIGGFMADNSWIITDNSWIIPYNPYLSAKYNCLINVECAASLPSFKYLFKYIQKGGDIAGMQVQNKRDEITRWIEGRYISAAESAWRVFHFDMHDQVPAVQRLQVYTFSSQRLFIAY
jgi:hypothetical protein